MPWLTEGRSWRMQRNYELYQLKCSVHQKQKIRMAGSCKMNIAEQLKESQTGNQQAEELEKDLGKDGQMTQRII